MLLGLLRDDRGKTVLNEPLEDFRTRDQDADFGPAHGRDAEEGAVLQHGEGAQKAGAGKEKGDGPAARKPSSGGEHAVVVARAAHDVRDEVEAFEAFRIHQQHAVAGGPEIDLALARFGFHFHAFAGHVPGKAAGRVVLVYPAFRMGIVFLHIDAVAAHLLKAADVARRQFLSGGEGGPLFLAGDDLGHVVQGVLADGLFHGHGDGRGHGFGLLRQRHAGPFLIGGLALTGAADTAVGGGVIRAAEGATGRLAEGVMAEEVLAQAHGLKREDGFPGFLDLGLKAFAVLFPFGAFLEEPAADFVVGTELVVVQMHADAFTRALVVERHGVDAEGQHAQPAVAHRAGGEQLHGVGQAVGRFAYGVVQHAFGHVAFGEFHHVAADDQAGSRVPVKSAGLLDECFVRPLAESHDYLNALALLQERAFGGRLVLQVLHGDALRRRKAERFRRKGSVRLEGSQRHFVGVAVKVQYLHLLDQGVCLVHPQDGLHKLRGRFLRIEAQHGHPVFVGFGFNGKILVQPGLSRDHLNDGARILHHFGRVLIGKLFVGQIVPDVLVRDDQQFRVRRERFPAHAQGLLKGQRSLAGFFRTAFLMEEALGEISGKGLHGLVFFLYLAREGWSRRVGKARRRQHEAERAGEKGYTHSLSPEKEVLRPAGRKFRQPRLYRRRAF